MMRPTLSLEKKVGIVVVPAMRLKKRLVWAWLPRRATKSCCITGGGGQTAAGAHALGEVGGEVEGLEVVSLDVRAILMEVADGPACAEAGKAVIRGEAEDGAAIAGVELHPAELNAAPVAVVAALEGRAFV